MILQTTKFIRHYNEKGSSSEYVPIWPTKIVSIREAMGSAATARAAGNAIPRISFPSSSHLKTSLEENIFESVTNQIDSDHSRSKGSRRVSPVSTFHWAEKVSYMKQKGIYLESLKKTFIGIFHLFFFVTKPISLAII